MVYPAGGQEHAGAKGQSSMRCFATTGAEPGQLQMKELSCGCSSCRTGRFQDCKEKDAVSAWVPTSVRRRGTRAKGGSHAAGAASQVRPAAPRKGRRDSCGWTSSGEEEGEAAAAQEEQPTLSSMVEAATWGVQVNAGTGVCTCEGLADTFNCAHFRLAEVTPATTAR